MMLRRSPFRWLVLAGIMLFLAGLLFDILAGKSGNAHLVLGIPVKPTLSSMYGSKKDSLPEQVAFTLETDSIHVNKIPSVFELQVREIKQEFSNSVHTSIVPPSSLIKSYALVPMKIHKIEGTDYRFRLKQFYPDFTFHYSYPENKDTIPPRAPGITINLVNAGKEDVVTLRSDKPNLRKLDDVAGLGYVLEFFWTISQDSLYVIMKDTAVHGNKIVFAGKDQKIYWLTEDRVDSMKMENKFYPVPGKEGVGFTILQYFPDVHWLKAEPATRSEKIENPVAQVEIWKLGEGAQNLFLYPNEGDRHGGEWRVPGKNWILTCNADHKMLVDACHCKVNYNDTLREVMTTKAIQGPQVLSIGKMNMELTECDPAGMWVNMRIWTSPGHYFKWTGLVMALASFLGLWFQGKKIMNRNNKLRE